MLNSKNPFAEQMVNSQLLTRDITDQKVIRAMSVIPRHLFVPEDYHNSAYEDHPIPIGEGQTISQPYIVALMTQLLGLTGSDKVLEIGTGSGYQTSILAEISKKIYTVERIKSLSERAQKVLESLGYKNVLFKIDDGSEGWEEHAPFDRIIVTAAAASIPESYIKQLSDKNGRLVIPIGDRFRQVLTLVEKSDGKIKKTEISGVVFVPLVGKYSNA